MNATGLRSKKKNAAGLRSNTNATPCRALQRKLNCGMRRPHLFRQNRATAWSFCFFEQNRALAWSAFAFSFRLALSHGASSYFRTESRSGVDRLHIFTQNCAPAWSVLATSPASAAQKKSRPASMVQKKNALCLRNKQKNARPPEHTENVPHVEHFHANRAVAWDVRKFSRRIALWHGASSDFIQNCTPAWYFCTGWRSGAERPQAFS